MSRLIDADALLEGIAELKQSPWFNDKYGYVDRKEAVEAIEDLCIKKEPTIDAVEVVRCENCRHANECHKSVQYTRNELYTVAIGFLPIEWCSRGERKNESEVEK